MLVRFSRLLRVLPVALFIFSGEINAQTTRIVGASGAEYTTIQAAVDAAVDGDIILVGTGTYPESILLTDINGLTIKAADGATPVIDGSSFPRGTTLLKFAPASSGAIQDVRIEGMTFRNIPIPTTGSASSGHGIAMYTTTAISGIEIIGNTFDNTDAADENHRGAAIVLDNVDGLLIENNTLLDAAQYGSATAEEVAAITLHHFQRSNSLSDVTVRGNVINGAKRGIWAGRGGPNVNAIFDNVLLENNTFSNIEREGVRGDSEAAGGDERLVILNNEFIGTWRTIRIGHSNTTRGNIEVTGNTIHTASDQSGDYGVRVEGGNVTIEENEIDGKSIGVIVDSNAGTFVIRSNEFGDNGRQVDLADGFLASIDGILSDNDFERSVTIRQPGGTIASPVIFSAIQDGVDAADAGGSLVVSAGIYNESVTIDKSLSITGSDPDEKPEITGSGTRVSISASDVTLEYLTLNLTDDTSTDGVIVVNRIGSWPFEIGYSDITFHGIEVLGGRRALVATVQNITIENSQFTGQYRDALFFNAVSGTTTIQGNTVTGADASKAIVFENFSSGDPAVSGSIHIDNNTIEGKRNFIVYNQWQCSELQQVGGGFVCEEDEPNEKVAIQITNNQINPFGTAIDIFDPREYVSFDPVRFEKIGSLSVSDNRFLRIGTTAVKVPDELFEDHGILTDARNNWWGSPEGPSDEQVIGNVQSIQWCLDTNCTTFAGAPPVTVGPSGADYTSIQSAIDASDAGTTIQVQSGVYTENVTVGKEGIRVEGEAGARISITAGTTGIKITAADVSVEGMEITGPYDLSFMDVDWDNEPTTEGIVLQPNAVDATISGNTIRNVRTGVQVLSNAPGATITDNTIDNTKGSILLRSDVAELSGNAIGTSGSEWDIVILASIWPASPASMSLLPDQHDLSAYGSAVVSLSENNGGMTILDRRFGDKNRSHAVIEEGHAPGPEDDFGLGNGLGNPRQPYGSINHGISSVTYGGVVSVRAGTYGPVLTEFGGPENITIQAVQGAVPLITGSSTPKRVVDLRADGTTFRGFSVSGPNDHVGIAISGRNVTVENAVITSGLTGIITTTQYASGQGKILNNQISGVSVGMALQNSDNEVKGNTITASQGGMGIGSHHTTAPPGISGNTISGNSFTVTSGASVSVLYFANVDLNKLLAENTFNRIVRVLNSSGAIATTTVNGINGFRVFASIQSAINAANTGSIIEAEQGIYTENLAVKSNLTIRGKNPANRPVLRGSITNSSTGLAANAVTPLTNLLIRDLIVQNSPYLVRWYHNGTSVTLNGVVFDRVDFILNGPYSGADSGISRQGDGNVILGSGGYTFRNSRFESNGQNPGGSVSFLWISTTTSGNGPITFENNTFVGKNANMPIMISGGSPLLFSGNKISGGGNVSLSRSANVTVSNNQFETVGITLAGVHTATISGNQFANIASGNRSIRFEGVSTPPPQRHNLNISITGNTFTNVAATAIQVGPYASSFTLPAQTENFLTVSKNDFSGVSGQAITNSFSSFRVNAASNWWGHPSGPSHSSNSNGTGKKISDHVDYKPWYINKEMTLLSSELGPDKLSITTQPLEGIAGKPVGGPPAVLVLNNLGNPVPGANVTVSLASGASLNSGTLTVVTGSDGKAQFSNLVINTAGSYRLAFKVANLTSVLSNEFLLAPDVSVPSAPLNLLAEPGNRQVELSWDEPANNGGEPITRYNVEYSAGFSGGWTVVQGESITETSVTVSGLVNNIRHRFRVTAENIIGAGPVSELASAVPVAPIVDNDEDPPPPVPPGGAVSVVNGVEIPITKGLIDPGTLQLGGEGFQMSFSSQGENGEQEDISTEDDEPVFNFEPGGSLKTGGGGFAPGSSVAVWLFSTPRLLGFVDVDADGNFLGEIPIPRDIEVRSHTLRIQGVGQAGEERMMALGVQVKPNRATSVSALDRIKGFASSDGTGTAPSVADFSGLGILGVTAESLDAILQAIAAVDADEVDSIPKIRVIVDELLTELAFEASLSRIRSWAAASGTGEAPAVDDYETTGVTGVTEENLGRMNSAVADAGDADSPEVIQVIVDEVLALLKIEEALARIRNWAVTGGTGDAPALNDYVTAGVTGVTEENIDRINNAVADVDEEEAASAEMIQMIVDDVLALLEVEEALNTIRTYAAQDGASEIPTLNDYVAAGITGVTEENIVRVNIAIAASDEEDADSAEKIQAIVDEVLLHLTVSEYNLLQNYPNPFRNRTTIEYHVLMQADVTITVYDILGRPVETILREPNHAPGIYEHAWDVNGQASGVYIYRMTAKGSDGETFRKYLKLVMVK